MLIDEQINDVKIANYILMYLALCATSKQGNEEINFILQDILYPWEPGKYMDIKYYIYVL